MRVEVEQADIDGGCRCDASECAGARAVKRATGAEHVALDIYTVNVFGGPYGGQYVTPEPLKEFILSFDNEGRQAVRPFVFELK